MKYKILNAESQNYSPKAKVILESIANVDYFANLSKSKMKEKITDFHGLIVRLENYIGPEIIKKGNRLLFIATATTGLDHIDLKAAKDKGVEIISLFGEKKFLDDINATAEHTMALMLSLVRHIPFAHADVFLGFWRRDKFRGMELGGKTLGIIGMGRLGRKVAHYATEFGMKVITYDPYLKKKPTCVALSSIKRLLSEADIVTLHIPLNESTRNIFNEDYFKLMKKDSLLINTSRGEVVDEKALLRSLTEKRIRGAALDVLTGECDERILKKHPLINYAKKNSNIIITPHLGGATWESMEKTEIFIAQKIKDFLTRYRKI